MGGESRDTGFGEALRAAREEAGLSRQDLAETTRVPLRHLEALEEERWDSLPRGVIGRGFVRLVAKDLGLPAEELLERYRRARGEVEGPAPLVIPQGQWAPELRRERGPGPVLIATLLLVGAALGIWVWSPWSVERPAPVPGVEAPEAVLPRPIPAAPAPSGELPQSQPEPRSRRSSPPSSRPPLPRRHPRRHPTTGGSRR
ncbi:MAG: helix-turn-helix domain-containing protein [Deferrisomatales bacterium]|nr:helix-turn-helix domain-containing protein [Deferrisomatales bacterium]